MAWTLNLYGEIIDEQVSAGELDTSAILDADKCYEFAQKIRERARAYQPNDIWVGRGYAWSLHVRGRAMAKRGDEEGARNLLLKALEFRKKLAERLPGSFGLQIDIEKNECDLVFYNLL